MSHQTQVPDGQAWLLKITKNEGELQAWHLYLNITNIVSSINNTVSYCRTTVQCPSVSSSSWKPQFWKLSSMAVRLCQPFALRFCFELVTTQSSTCYYLISAYFAGVKSFRVILCACRMCWCPHGLLENLVNKSSL